MNLASLTAATNQCCYNKNLASNSEEFPSVLPSHEQYISFEEQLLTEKVPGNIHQYRKI